MFYNVGEIYNQNKIEFNPLSDKLSDASTTSNTIISQDVVKKRQLQQQNRTQRKQVASDRLGLSVNEYDDMKQDIASKGIKDPTQTQINQAVNEVKSAPSDAPPMAS